MCSSRVFSIAALAVALLVTPVKGATSLQSGAKESRWSVNQGATQLATITLLSDARGAVRAEWRPAGKAAALSFIGSGGKTWAKQPGGDVELSAYRGGIEKSIVPALLVPNGAAASSAIVEKDGRPTSFAYSGGKATYLFDAKGASSIDVVAGGQTYKLHRTAISESHADASYFAVTSKGAASSNVVRLAGSLLGPSDRSVSATAGGRGVTEVKAHGGSGDYAALKKLVARDNANRALLDEALDEFQKDGKVGKSRGDR